MSFTIEARAKLDEYAEELDGLSRNLAANARKLEPIAKEYEEFISDFEAGMWQRYEKEEGKWPGEAFRIKLARRAMDPELRNRYDALANSAKRMQTRIGELKKLVEAQRSIVSAEKAELEATT